MKERRSPAYFLCYLLASADPSTVFSWASFFPHSSLAASPGLCPQLLWWGCQQQSSCCAGRSLDTCPGWELGEVGGETCQVHQARDPPEIVLAQQGSPVPLRGTCKSKISGKSRAKLNLFDGPWRSSLRLYGLELTQKPLVSLPVPKGLSVAGFPQE